MPKLPFIVAIAAAIITLGFFGFVSNAPAYGAVNRKPVRIAM